MSPAVDSSDAAHEEKYIVARVVLISHRIPAFVSDRAHVVHVVRLCFETLYE